MQIYTEQELRCSRCIKNPGGSDSGSLTEKRQYAGPTIFQGVRLKTFRLLVAETEKDSQGSVTDA